MGAAVVLLEGIEIGNWFVANRDKDAIASMSEKSQHQQTECRGASKIIRELCLEEVFFFMLVFLICLLGYLFFFFLICNNSNKVI